MPTFLTISLLDADTRDYYLACNKGTSAPGEEIYEMNYHQN